jgi:hypothetical protein
MTKEYVYYSPEMNLLITMFEAPLPGNEQEPHRLCVDAEDGSPVLEFEETYIYLGEL